MKKILSLTLGCLLALGTGVCAVCAKTEAADASLSPRFGADGKFTILHISDPQDDMYPAKQLKGFLEKAIALSEPDIIVFGGDTVEDSRIGDLGVDEQNLREGVKDDKDYAKTLENTKKACDNIFSLINDKKIPFVFTQGNNDYKCIENEDWLKIYSSYEYCLMKDESDDEEGRLDCHIPILSSDGERIAFNLYMIDNGKSENPNAGQLQWYKDTSDALKAQAGEPVKSFVFEHRPIAEVGNLFVSCKPWEKGAILSGLNSYKLGKNAEGHAETYYKPGSSEQFALWKQQSDVIGAYFGHIHTDGFTGVYDGIELGLTYGCEFAKSGPYGIRVFTLDENDIMNYDNTLYVFTNGQFKKQSGNGDASLSIWLRIAAFFRRAFASLFV